MTEAPLIHIALTLSAARMYCGKRLSEFALDKGEGSVNAESIAGMGLSAALLCGYCVHRARSNGVAVPSVFAPRKVVSLADICCVIKAGPGVVVWEHPDGKTQWALHPHVARALAELLVKMTEVAENETLWHHLDEANKEYPV